MKMSYSNVTVSYTHVTVKKQCNLLSMLHCFFTVTFLCNISVTQIALFNTISSHLIPHAKTSESLGTKEKSLFIRGLSIYLMLSGRDFILKNNYTNNQLIVNYF